MALIFQKVLSTLEKHGKALFQQAYEAPFCAHIKQELYTHTESIMGCLLWLGQTNKHVYGCK